MNFNKITALIMTLCISAGAYAYLDINNCENTITASCASGYTESTSGIFTYYKYSDHIQIQSCDKSATKADIPATIDGLPVTSLDTFSFMGCHKLKEVNIPESVTKIGGWAFEYCTSLSSVNIPLSIESIGQGAFNNTPALEMQNGIQYVGNALLKCEDASLSHVDVRNGTTIIASNAFKDCTNLKSVALPNGLASIASGAFWNCTELTEIKLPNTLKNIGSSAFSGCTKLNNVIVPNQVTKLKGSTFHECTNLSKISLPDTLTQIYRDDFDSTGITMNQNGIKYADKWIVDCDTNVTSVTIRPDTKGIGYGAFEQCQSLVEVNLPDNVSVVGEDVFYGCNILKKVTVNNPDCTIFDSPYTFPNKTDIYGYEASTAEHYAKKYGRSFFALAQKSTSAQKPDPDSKPSSAKNTLGDVNEDGNINALDASLVLTHYALIATGRVSPLNDTQKMSADINGDSHADALDASGILSYYAYTATGGKDTLDVFMKK